MHPPPRHAAARHREAVTRWCPRGAARWARWFVARTSAFSERPVRFGDHPGAPELRSRCSSLAHHRSRFGARRYGVPPACVKTFALQAWTRGPYTPYDRRTERRSSLLRRPEGAATRGDDRGLERAVWRASVTDDPARLLGGAIRHHRISRNWTQRGLGERVHASQTRISRIERGATRLDCADREMFEHVFGLRRGGLLCEIGRVERAADTTIEDLAERLVALERSIVLLQDVVMGRTHGG